jgi:hypothetical protein
MQIVKFANFCNPDPTAFQAYNHFTFHWEKMNTRSAVTCHNAKKYLLALSPSVVGSCFRLFSDILVPDGIEEGNLQHIA